MTLLKSFAPTPIAKIANGLKFKTNCRTNALNAKAQTSNLTKIGSKIIL